jgi:hypothetical protein
MVPATFAMANTKAALAITATVPVFPLLTHYKQTVRFNRI